MKKHLLIKIDSSLSLMEPDLGYAAELFKMLEESRPYYEEWISWTSKAKSLKEVENFLNEARLFNVGGQKFSSMIFENDQFVGMMNLHRVDKIHRKAEMGYWLKKNVQGQGIIQRCMPSMLNYAFKNLNLNRIELIIGTTNLKSIRTAEKCGFHKEGELKEYFFVKGEAHNAFIFRMLKGEFIKSDKFSV